MLYSPSLTPIFDKWNVEKITFYDWYEYYDTGFAKLGIIPLAWKNLKQITVYPELTPRGEILFRSNHIPTPFPIQGTSPHWRNSRL
jgi:hypothetical protein